MKKKKISLNIPKELKSKNTFIFIRKAIKDLENLGEKFFPHLLPQYRNACIIDILKFRNK